MKTEHADALGQLADAIEAVHNAMGRIPCPNVTDALRQLDRAARYLHSEARTHAQP